MLTSMSCKIKCLKRKKSHRRREITDSAAWPETHTSNKGEQSSWATQGKKQQNIPPPFEKRNYTSKRQKVGDQGYQGTVQQLWLIFTYKGRDGGSARDRQQRPYVNSSMTLIHSILLGAATVVTRSSPGGTHQQHRIHPSGTYVLAAWGTSLPRAPGHHALAQQPGTSLRCLIQTSAGVNPIISLTSPIQNHTWYSYRHSASISIHTMNAEGICPCYSSRDHCWKDGQKPWCPPRRQTRLAAVSKIRALLQAPFSLRKRRQHWK